MKERLLENALAAIAEDGLRSLSLRKVARRTGVSHNAPYMHFADKEALLSAIAEEGFGLLGTALEHAAATAESGSVAHLRALGLAYVAFARTHPERFEVMFAGDARALVTGGLGLATFDRLVRAVASGQASGALRPGPTRELALTFWATVHGFARLEAAGRLGPALLGAPPGDALDAAVVDHAIAGFAR